VVVKLALVDGVNGFINNYQIDYFIPEYNLADTISLEPDRPYYDTGKFHELYKNDHFVVYSLRLIF